MIVPFIKPYFCFRLDARDKPIGQAEEWKDEKILGQRATFRLKDRPAILLISSVKEDDGAVYYCRVDFRQTPTRNIKVNLSVISKFLVYTYILKFRKNCKVVKMYKQIYTFLKLSDIIQHI